MTDQAPYLDPVLRHTETGFLYTAAGIPVSLGAPIGSLTSPLSTSALSTLDAATALAAKSAHRPKFSVSILEFPLVGPFASWINVKTAYGAKGDGITDDSAAIQAAINALGGGTGNPYVLYFPPGTYLIKTALTLSPKKAYEGVVLIGDSQLTTVIKWGGAPGAFMLTLTGGYGTSCRNLTWDGGGTAFCGPAHLYDTSLSTYFGGSCDHLWCTFQNFAGIGLMAGRQGAHFGTLDSEGFCYLCTFKNCTYAGFDTGSPNAVDWWLWYCTFVNCARGASNTYGITDSGPGDGYGEFHCYKCVFLGSTVSDIAVYHTPHWTHVWGCYSSGSQQFFNARDIGQNCSCLLLRNNVVVGLLGTVAIEVDNPGPVTLLDNFIASSSYAVKMNGVTSGRDIVSIGNTYTAQTPIYTATPLSDRVVQFEDTIVSSITATAPALPSPPTWLTNTQVFEVTSAMSAAQIQAQIDAAAAAYGPNTQPVVHFQPCYYSDRPLADTLRIPPSIPLILTGDGFGSAFNWGGTYPGPMMAFHGPSQAIALDLQFVGAPDWAVYVTETDQPGGRIYSARCEWGSVDASNLAQTALEFQATPLMQYPIMVNCASVQSIGIGSQFAQVQLDGTYGVFTDSWSETTYNNLLHAQSGKISIVGGQLGPSAHLPTSDPGVTGVVFNQFQGTYLILAVNFFMDNASVPTAISVGTELPVVTNVCGLSCTADSATPYVRTGSGGAVGFTNCRNFTAGATTQFTNIGQTNLAFLLQSLTQLRSLAWDAAPYSPPPGATNLRLVRVRASQVAQGLVLESGTLTQWAGTAP